jgi:hypothetical protein
VEFHPNKLWKIQLIEGTSVPNLKRRIYCQLWQSPDNPPIVLELQESRIFSKHLDDQPEILYILNFQLNQKVDFSSKTPAALSLVEHKCDAATNLIKLQKPEVAENPKDFVVCLKDIFVPFVDISKYLVEWLEMLRALGAQLVVIYSAVLEQHQSVQKILRLVNMILARPISNILRYYQPSSQDLPRRRVSIADLFPLARSLFVNSVNYETWLSSTFWQSYEIRT